MVGELGRDAKPGAGTHGYIMAAARDTIRPVVASSHSDVEITGGIKIGIVTDRYVENASSIM